jgi:hypothetical protein
MTANTAKAVQAGLRRPGSDGLRSEQSFPTRAKRVIMVLRARIIAIGRPVNMD